jgi:DNA-directed RNA polymerase specialized sigma24 family protein
VGAGYDRALVERLLPAVFDGAAAYGLKNETQPDPDMPKVKANPKHANTLYAHLADMHDAWKWVMRGGLSKDEARALVMRYQLDWTYDLMAYHDGRNKSTMQRRCEKGVGKITAFLNGEQYVDGYDAEIEEEAA